MCDNPCIFIQNGLHPAGSTGAKKGSSALKTKVYIDGQEGTTGLRIYERIAARADVEWIRIDAQSRKDPAARRDCIHASDVTFLCLPDAAAREAVVLAEGSKTRLIDASTAHRTAPGWQYGFPELSGARRAAIASADRVAVPGCHASGFCALVYPLVAAGVLPADAALTCFSLTGYTGGGRRMIEAYEAADRPAALDSPRQYGLTQTHKHLPEMQVVCGLAQPPLFSPVVGDFACGMEVTVPLFASQLARPLSRADLRDLLAAHYAGAALVTVAPLDAEIERQGGFLDAGALAGCDGMELYVAGNDERMLLIARFDNLGKGASGAAIQCMNLMLGCEETTGLVELPARQ